MKASASSSADSQRLMATEEQTGAKSKFDIVEASLIDEIKYVKNAGGGFAKLIADVEAMEIKLTDSIEAGGSKLAQMKVDMVEASLADELKHDTNAGGVLAKSIADAESKGSEWTAAIEAIGSQLAQIKEDFKGHQPESEASTPKRKAKKVV